MSVFSSGKRNYRSWFKPGLRTYNFAIPPVGGFSPRYAINSNVDASADPWGSQWVRDASLPSLKTFINSLSVTRQSFPGELEWRKHENTQLFAINQGFSAGFYLYQMTVHAGDPATTWQTAPLYMQLFIGSSPPITSGVSVPVLCLPVPRPPLFLDFHPDGRIPFIGHPNGAQVALSSTRDVYTSTATTGFFNLALAYCADVESL